MADLFQIYRTPVDDPFECFAENRVEGLLAGDPGVSDGDEEGDHSLHSFERREGAGGFDEQGGVDEVVGDHFEVGAE